MYEIVSPGSGRIVSLDLTAGQPVSAGDPLGLVFLESTGPPEVVAFVSPVDAGRLHAGMSASVTVAGPAGASDRAFLGKVAEVSPRAESPPQWLLEQGLTVPVEPHLLRVALSVTDKDLPAAGSGVSLRIVLERVSVASLLVPGGSG